MTRKKPINSVDENAFFATSLRYTKSDSKMNSNSLCLFSAILISLGAFSENLKKGSINTPFFEQGMAISESRYPKSYNASARIDVSNGWNLDVDISFIYWHVSQELMDIAVKELLIDQTPKNIVYQPFDYKPGFKIGAGWKSNYDNWSFFAEYTQLHQTTDYSHSLSPDYYWNLSSWFDLLDLAQMSLGSKATEYFPEKLTSSWTMHFDLMDIGVTRPFYQGRAIVVSPYAGLRALWITQKMALAANPNTDSSATSSNRSHCWSLGPNAGVKTYWISGGGFRVEGMGSASLLYTSYTKLNTKQFLSASATVSSIPVEINASANDYNTIRPSIEIGLGIGWGRYFNKNNCYFDFSTRYDFLQFWNQNMIRYWTSALYGQPEPIGDLQFHGLTATARFDF